MLGEPVFERGWEFFEGKSKRNDVPEDKIEVIFIHESFASLPQAENFGR
jgi:hypothetical protein